MLFELADLATAVGNCNLVDFTSFYNALSQTLDRHAPYKVKVIRGNHQPHLDKNLRKAIMTRSRLKNKFNKSGKLVDFNLYKKQRNFVVLNRSCKKRCFKSIKKTKMAINRSSGSNDRIFLHDHDDLLSDEYDIANKYLTDILSILRILSQSLQ